MNIAYLLNTHQYLFDTCLNTLYNTPCPLPPCELLKLNIICASVPSTAVFTVAFMAVFLRSSRFVQLSP